MKKMFLMTLVVFGLSSCKEQIMPPKYIDAPTQFIVTDIADKEGMNKMARYEIEVVDVNGLVSDQNNSSINLRFWFCDSVGKYRMGQPIRFDIIK